ncbi:ATP-binding protein [uncultured Aquimarina sp.]|uniref:ATP-binding protein n=1 Tax=uncultured Aquimarina sp. TaxID=575652 RepID=UPI0026192176|nr:ATP-binding protein [uncultured Aquimarina sp.]
MKKVNLISIIQAYNKLNRPLYIKYFDYFNVKPKSTELDDLKLFVSHLFKVDNNIENLKDYYFGYNIPQIGKEFDLLRFGENYNINVELKSKNTGVKIINQLKRNKYYLGFLRTDTHYYTFVSSEKKLYTLDDSDNLVVRDLKELVHLLENQILKQISNVDSLFNPSNYLVSPFNSTEKFIKNKYFLTNQQEQIKKESIKALSKKKASFISISGKAGTGKTLVTYDIVKYLIENKERVLLVHCGNLNRGHKVLNDKYKWGIIPAKHLRDYDLKNYDIVVVDETQRIYPTQLENIIDNAKANNSVCVFSYDKSQCLHQWEINNDIEKQIEDKTASKVFKLTKKIRTNKEIAAFIISLLDKGVNYKSNTSNIELNYFSNTKDASIYIEQLGVEGWKIVNYTPSIYILPYDSYKILGEDSTHEVVGQEYDAVVAVIDSYFFYDSTNQLSTKGYQSYYHPTKMLSQIMTRTRKKLSIVVINNEEVMDRCLDILN